MSHTFHLSFFAPSGSKRTYCIALPDAQSRTKWAMLLPRQINRCRTNAAQSSIDAEAESQDQGVGGGVKRRMAAEALGLGVLRDSLIGDQRGSEPGRRGSVSTTYDGAMGKDEVDALGPLRMREGIGQEVSTGDATRHEHGHRQNGSEVEMHGHPTQPLSLTTGKEIVLVCRQNSIMPDLLDMLRPTSSAADAGHETANPYVRRAQGASINDHDGTAGSRVDRAAEEVDRREWEREREYEAESRAQSRAAGRF